MSGKRVRGWVYLGLRDELGDLLAGVEGGHLHVGHAPVRPTGRVQDLVMLLQDLTEPGEVQVLGEEKQGVVCPIGIPRRVGIEGVG